MEDSFVLLIAEIIEMIENNNENRPPFIYGNSKDVNGTNKSSYEKTFYIKDESRMMDFEARFGENNFMLKDNIGKTSFIATKVFLTPNTSIRRILIMDDVYQSYTYISFFKRDDEFGLIRVEYLDRKDAEGKEEYTVCINPYMDKKSKEEMLDYIDWYVGNAEIESTLDDSFEDTEEIEETEDVEIEDVDENLNITQETTENGAVHKLECKSQSDKSAGENSDNSIENDENSYEENQKEIVQYSDGISEDNEPENYEDSEINESDYDRNESSEPDLEDDFVFEEDDPEYEYKVIIDGEKVTEEPEKSKTILDCQMDISAAYIQLLKLEMATQSLKMVLSNMEKDIEPEK